VGVAIHDSDDSIGLSRERNSRATWRRSAAKSEARTSREQRRDFPPRRRAPWPRLLREHLGADPERAGDRRPGHPRAGVRAVPLHGEAAARARAPDRYQPPKPDPGPPPPLSIRWRCCAISLSARLRSCSASRSSASSSARSRSVVGRPPRFRRARSLRSMHRMILRVATGPRGLEGRAVEALARPVTRPSTG
jgi:hypothetical protein